MKYMVIGGAGFIGSHVVKRLFAEEADARIVVYDNFSSGREEHLGAIANADRLHVIRGDVKDADRLDKAMEDMDIVYSLASNPDIAKAASRPDIDFWEGTYLVNNVLEAMRRNGVGSLLYASGSGVYGDVGAEVTDEDFSPLLPASTYGASKLACEAMICAYCHMFGMDAAAFRFANVVGPDQTHGVGYDFVRKLSEDPGRLEILGDGTQSKSYIYVDDVVDALRTVERKALRGYGCYNVATLDHITVTEIADITVRTMGLEDVEYRYTGGDRGWRGDVPVVRLDSRKIRRLGWRSRYDTRQAVEMSVAAMHEKRRRGDAPAGDTPGAAFVKN